MPRHGLALATPIKLRFSTIDHFSEIKVYRSLEGASAYAQRRMGDMYDISETFGYAIDMHGIGKLEVVSGHVTLKQLLNRQE